ncbi:hydroxymethylbilane synthase [Kineococcus radiotolerans]|uniref:Porphobilinogen deaminase n=1 Tax=Kineococcus radiotolerans (strain ATCC BAA-149 / DSM 14245 / SRS30216) TaxID=266940 RepID=A6W5L8_KINRD|nr:hydroxymethylbilane synthase [Kineococcus radiotolerans]ABS02107.1 porphobilinogen deaminase [Kineococcus radiotolerans SRS30216 = ATCC BAA-149]
MTRPLRLGTRRSALATTQSSWVADLLRRGGSPVELVEITTRGDVDRAPLAQIGGTGVFVSALRDALLAGEVDLAVHSLKDLPTSAADGLALAAVPGREDPRDVLVAAGGATLADLPRGARVGTGSPRRRALLLALRPDLDVVAVRGNVDTRIGFATGGELDAVVLAAAGLARTGRLHEASELFAPEVFVPAPGQGALAVECRADDAEVLAALAALDVPAVRWAVAAERQVLASLEAGCSAPVGAHAAGGVLHVAVEDPDGALVRRAVPAAGLDDEGAARRLGASVAADLLEHELAQTPVAVGGGAQENHPQDRPVDGPRPDPESGS